MLALAYEVTVRTLLLPRGFSWGPELASHAVGGPHETPDDPPPPPPPQIPFLLMLWLTGED